MGSPNNTDVGRRLAAIVIADVVGYTRLMERDETGTFARLACVERAERNFYAGLRKAGVPER